MNSWHADAAVLTSLDPAPAYVDSTRPEALAVLDAAISDERVVGPARSTRPRAVLVAAAAVTLAAGAAVAPAFIGKAPSIALAPAGPLTFPASPAWMPASIGEPVFVQDNPHVRLAMYGRQDSPDRITITVPDSLAYWGEIPADAARTRIAGQPAEEWAGGSGAVRSYTIVWTEADGDVVGVEGSGSFAQAPVLEKVARSMTDRPQEVGLRLSIAPVGWSVSTYASDQRVSYGADDALSVELLKRPGSVNTTGAPLAVPGTIRESGAVRLHEVEVGGRPGTMGELLDADGGNARWLLESTTPGGQPFLLQASPELSSDQVVEIAAGIRSAG